MSHDTQKHSWTSAERFLALSQVGTALMRELNEERLLQLIARTACDLTGATFAAFSLRPIDEQGPPQGPAEGSLFHLAAVVGVTPEQEALFRRMPLGGEGLLAPIFRHGVPVLVADALAHLPVASHVVASHLSEAKAAQEAAFAFAHGWLSSQALPSLGVPGGHPLVRSFLGAPLLDHAGEVRGGLLLGHAEPDQFTQEDQAILLSLAGQAAVALENFRLSQQAQVRALELQSMFDSISDGVILLDSGGKVLQENAAARQARRTVLESPQAETLLEALLTVPAQSVRTGSEIQESMVQVSDAQGERRDYLVTAQPLRPARKPSGPLSQDLSTHSLDEEPLLTRAVVIWHDVTERRLREVTVQAQERTSYLEAIFEAMVDGVYVYDQEGRIVQMNAAAHTLLARTQPPGAAARPLEERFGWATLIGVEGQNLPPEQWPSSRMLQGEQFTPEHAVELQMPTLDGGVLYASATGGPIRDASGQIIGAVGVSRDVTERKRAEQALQKAERQAQEYAAQLEAILEAMPDILLAYDGEGHINRTNAAGGRFLERFRLTGVASGSIEERAQQATIYTEQGVVLPFEEWPTSRILRGETLTPENTVDLMQRDPQGNELFVSTTGGPLYDAQGRCCGGVFLAHDITERKRIERQLQEQSQLLEEAERQAQERAAQLETIFEAIPDGLILTDASGNQLRVNSAIRALFGLQEQPEALSGSIQALAQSLQLRDEDEQPRPSGQIAITRILRGETLLPSNPSIALIRALDGQPRYLSTTGAPLYDEDGHIIGAVSVSRDITEQKRAERLREQQAARLHLQASLIDLAHDAIIVRDPHSAIVSWNQGAEALYGWSAQQARGQVTHSLLQTRFPISMEFVDNLLEQEGEWEGELAHTCRDGSTAYVESRQVLVRDAEGQPSAILEINRDVTAQRHLEQLDRSARAEARSRLTLLQLILDELPSSIYLVRGPEARLVLANRATATNFGAKWAPGQPLREFLAGHDIRILRPNGRPLEPEQLPALRVVQQGETVRQFQQVIRHADETTLSVLVNAVPLDAASLLWGRERATSNTDEPERAALVMCQDVTALKDAEALKYEFLNVVSHELRTPLSILKGYADLLLQQASRGSKVPLSKLQLEGLQGISKAASRLTNLTEDLLDVTRLEVEQLDLPGDPANLGVQFFTWAAKMVK